MAGPIDKEQAFWNLAWAVVGDEGLAGSRTGRSWRSALSSCEPDAPSTPRFTPPEATAARDDIPLRTGPLTTAPRLFLIKGSDPSASAPATPTGYVVRAGRDVAVGARRALRGLPDFQMGLQQTEKGLCLSGQPTALHAVPSARHEGAGGKG